MGLHGFAEFGDAKFEPLDFAFQTVPMNDLPGENLNQTQKLTTTKEGRDIHQLCFGLDVFKELDGAIHRPGKEKNAPHPQDNDNGKHSFVVKIL
jgi:hypothetical protein